MSRLISKSFLIFSFCVIGILPRGSHAQDQIQYLTVQGGPIWTKHFQKGDDDFNEHHGLAVFKAHTKDYGNWALYLLSPNSVDRTSVGVGYVTNPYTIPMGPIDLELSGALGLVTGYQEYPVPLIVGEARFVLYKQGRWDAGLSVAANPYYSEERNGGGNEFGLVATTPFLSVRYKLY